MSDPPQPIAYTFEVSPRPVVFPVSVREKRPYWLHLLLLLLTMATTLIIGAQLYDNFLHGLPAFTLGSELMPLFHPKWIWQRPSRLLMGIPFSASLMAILLAHELGHFFFCEKYAVNATLPFFIPAPTLIGTMGAFIRIKSRIHSRKELFDIGVAGPIAGFVVAVPLLLLGLTLSKPLAPIMGIQSLDVGFPAVFHIAHWILTPGSGSTLPLRGLALHPVAVAAWVGMFATSLNLLPGGQLDGGHIVFSISPRLHRWTSILCVAALIPLGKFFWQGWFLWAVMLALTWRHPSVPRHPSVSGVRRWLAAFGVLMLVLTF